MIRVWLVAIFLAGGPGSQAFGQGDPAFYMGDGRTGEKPQSKVWFHDSTWWCILPGTVSGKTAHRIYRLKEAQWQLADSRKQVVDERAGARADVLPQGDAIYVLSFHPRQTRFIAYDYDVENKRYVQREGFPVVLSPLPVMGVETMVLAREGDRRFWAVFEGEPKGKERGEVRAIWSEDRDGKKWNLEGVRLGTGLDADDIATICRFAVGRKGKLAVIWSQQSAIKASNRDSAGANRLWMRVHSDGADPKDWEPPVLIASGVGLTDDHLNTAVARDGTIFFVTKTSLDDLKPVDLELPLLMLYRLPVDGMWEGYPVSPIKEGGTRPIVVLDDALGRLFVFYSRPVSGSSDQREIARRVSDKENIHFDSPDIAISEPGIYLNDPTSTRQRVSSHAGLMMMCWGQDKKKKGANRAYYRLYLLGGD